MNSHISPAWKMPSIKRLSLTKGLFTPTRSILKASSPLSRRQGALILRVVTGSEMGYNADDDVESRLEALERCRAWWKSDASWKISGAFSGYGDLGVVEEE